MDTPERFSCHFWVDCWHRTTVSYKRQNLVVHVILIVIRPRVLDEIKAMVIYSRAILVAVMSECYN